MNLLFIDESESELIEENRIVAITGVLVPAENYDVARKLFYQLLSERVDMSGRKIETRDGRCFRVADGMSIYEMPPELHGRRLLPDGDDNRRLEACAAVVQVIVECGLAVYRASLRMSRVMTTQVPTSGARYFECWTVLENELASVLEAAPVVPVLDSGNLEFQNRLAQFLQTRDFLRAHYPDPPLARPPANRLNELFLADSANSVLIQVADVVSYLLMQRDMAASGWQFNGGFKQRLVEIAGSLSPALVGEVRGQYERNDSRVSIKNF